jgi:hypothetical protein
VTVNGGLADGLLVRLDVEVDEEEEVACEERAAEERSTLSSGAGALGREVVRLPGRLGRKVRVCCRDELR